MCRIVNLPSLKYRNGCIQDKSVEIKEKPKSRFDEISNSLVDEERQMREDEFSKLNLPESEFLRTETSASHFPENNRPVEPSIKVDKEAINKTLKTSGQEAAKLVKSCYGSIKETAEKRRDERKQRMLEKREAEKAKLQKSYSSVNEVTHIDEVVEKESNLKTIEELKKPELASYPIVHPKTVEVIQEDQSENTQDYQEAKQIVEPDVKVEKDLPQQEKDPYVSKEDTVPSKFQKSSKWAWLQMKKGYQFIKQSDIAKQVIGVGIGCTSIYLSIILFTSSSCNWYSKTSFLYNHTFYGAITICIEITLSIPWYSSIHSTWFQYSLNVR